MLRRRGTRFLTIAELVPDFAGLQVAVVIGGGKANPQLAFNLDHLAGPIRNRKGEGTCEATRQNPTSLATRSVHTM